MNNMLKSYLLIKITYLQKCMKTCGVCNDADDDADDDDGT